MRSYHHEVARARHDGIIDGYWFLRARYLTWRQFEIGKVLESFGSLFDTVNISITSGDSP